MDPILALLCWWERQGCISQHDAAQPALAGEPREERRPCGPGPLAAQGLATAAALMAAALCHFDLGLQPIPSHNLGCCPPQTAYRGQPPSCPHLLKAITRVFQTTNQTLSSAAKSLALPLWPSSPHQPMPHGSACLIPPLGPLGPQSSQKISGVKDTSLSQFSWPPRSEQI